MAAALRIYWLILVTGIVHAHRVKREIHNGTAGRLFLLKCPIHGTISWSREGRNSSLPSGVEVRGQFLLFVPLSLSHRGSYTCENPSVDCDGNCADTREKTRRMKTRFNVSVSDDECPAPAENMSVSLSASIGLPCKQKAIRSLNTTEIKWLKDCHSLEHPEDSVRVSKEGFLRLPAATERDAGNYTCLVTVSFNGSTYTSGRSIQLRVDNLADSVITAPQVVCPEHQVKQVDLGAREELMCSADFGFSTNTYTSMYWTVNGSFAEDDELLYMSKPVFHANKGRLLGTSTLTVSKVLRRHLKVPFHCIVVNLAGQSQCEVTLHEADHSSVYKWMSVYLTVPLSVFALAAVVFFNRINIVLAYRNLLQHPGIPGGLDIGLYDAYVSFLNSNDRSLDTSDRFALQVLPEKLEKQHGYSLYISGRDDCPGEAKHEVIADAISRSRRLLIILSAEVPPSTNEKTQACPLLHKQSQYEQTLGLYDALTRNNLKVILVEIDGPVDYRRLPESLQYIKRKQGALKWKTTVSSRKRPSNRKFWKELVYHMPSIPAGRSNTAI